MEFLGRSPTNSSRLGILPAAFNPPTTAHLALAFAALQELDEVVLVLPGWLPHKNFDGASFTQRAQMLHTAARPHARLAAAITAGGLFVEIAEEFRGLYGPDIRLTFICGRDAAERIMGWNYSDPATVRRMLDSFHLLVASRNGEYEAPAEFRHRIRPLPVPGDLDNVSATDVRRRLREGIPWEHLVPTEIVPLVRDCYFPA